MDLSTIPWPYLADADVVHNGYGVSLKGAGSTNSLLRNCKARV